jgi:hypothetical protein|tara:strand:+ start:3356 stop:3790 length:435 start_codon:yes stop_codon:yes gene_type:complete
MIVPEKIHPRTGMTITVESFHRGEIKLAYRKLKTEIKRYLDFRLRSLKMRFKQKKVDLVFIEKCEHWRKNGGLTVVTDDTTDPFKSMADGKYYTSKKKYRNEVSARGYEEVGNDKQEHRVKDAYWAAKKHDKDIKQDIAEVLNG